MANIRTEANQTVPGKQVPTDKKPENNVLSSWEKRSSHIPIMNDMVEVTTSNGTEEKVTSHNGDKPLDTPTKTDSSRDRLQSDESGDQPVLRNAYCNSVKGKHVGRDQRQHQSLADAIEWPSDASAVVDTTAIGYKVYQSPGPTRCSKLRVFRPKTAAGVAAADEEARPPPTERRPASSGPRGRRAESLQEMDLAIYWDAPSRPPSQRRASVEPTSDQLSRPPTAGEEAGAKSSRPSVDEGSEPLVEGTPPANDTPRPEPVADDSTRSAEPAKSSARPKSAADSARRIPVIDLGAAAPPSERAGSRGRACGKRANRDAYKMAFKAGKLNNFEANEALLERLTKSRNLRVPKPKTPFAKKNYAIRTLTPPFSIWPQTSGYDYPDHWRLASVYQHAYKPLEARKSPFMKTVFR